MAEGLAINPKDPVIDPSVSDYVDISFRWRVANNGQNSVLLGGRIKLLEDGTERYVVHPGDRHSVRPDEPRHMLQYVGFVTELAPGGISEVSAWIQVGVENVRGVGPCDIVVAICDCAQPGGMVTGESAPTVIDHTEEAILTIGE